ncbi:MAG: hypothetical protein HOP13_17975 [Alphaproteobacteria bacterium]|nr:hypothetical protein [Alphaproteobacteria bacterium]
MPGVVIGSSASLVGEAWIGLADNAPSGATISPPAVPSSVTFPAEGVAFVYKPAAFGPGASVFAPSARRTAKPATWSNTPVLYALRITSTVKSSAFANGQNFFVASLKRALQTASFANGPTLFGPRLVLRISAAAFANAGLIYSAAVSQGSATKVAPHRPSSATVFAPSVILPVTTSVTATLSLPGLIPRAPKPPPRRSTATWPNLPNVTAPPWHLTVVTPDVARERARERMASAKRAERLRRKRKADRRTGEIVDTLIGEAIARTIVNVVAEMLSSRAAP